MSKRKYQLPWSIIIILLVGLIGVLCLTLSFVLGPNDITTNLGLPSPMVHFVSKEFHIAFDYPQSWFAHDLPQGNHGDMETIAFVIHAGPAGQPNVFIAQKLFTHPTL